VSRKKSQER